MVQKALGISALIFVEVILFVTGLAGVKWLADNASFFFYALGFVGLIALGAAMCIGTLHHFERF